MDISFESLANAVIRGIGSGSIYVLIAHGYNVIYAGTRVVNFAQGAVLMTGIYLGVWALSTLGLPLYLTFPVAIAAVAVLCMVEERVAVRPVARHGQAMLWITSTLGVSIILDNFSPLLWGPLTIAFPQFIDDTPLMVGGLVFSPVFIVITLACLFVGVLLTNFYRHTRAGRAMIAVSQDSDAAALRGIDPGRYAIYAFALSGALMGFSAVLVGPVLFADSNLALVLGIKGFIVAALGGLGSIRGAIVAGWILGIVESVGIIFTEVAYRESIALALFLAVLLIRPEGLYGFYKTREV